MQCIQLVTLFDFSGSEISSTPNHSIAAQLMRGVRWGKGIPVSVLIEIVQAVEETKILNSHLKIKATKWKQKIFELWTQIVYHI